MKSNNKKTLSFIPHPDRVIIKITKASWDELFYKKIIRNDGKEIQLFTQMEESEGYDKRFTQNVSLGVIVAVGDNVIDVYTTDLAILDYTVSNDNENLIGSVNGDRLVSIVAKTTYHTIDSKPDINMRKAYVKGDYDTVSPLLGIVRKKKIISFSPYIIMEQKSNLIVRVLPNGRLVETVEDISTRSVLAASNNSGYNDGDSVLLKEADMFSRTVNNKEVSLMYENEILCKKVNVC